MTTRRLLVLFGALLLGSSGVALVVWRIGTRLRRPPPATVLVSVANPADVETNEIAVLAHLEDALADVQHVASIDGRATSDGATVRVTLDRGVDPFGATQEIQHAVASKLIFLPREAMPPLVVIHDALDGPRLYVKAESFPLATIRENVDDRIGLALAKLDGVGLVSTCGGVDPAFVIALDPDRLVATGVDVLAVERALEAATDVKTVESLRDLSVGRVRLSDVATVSDDGRPPSCVAYGPDGPRVVGSLSWQPGAHPEKEVDAELTKQSAFLPVGMKVVRFDFDKVRVRAFVQLETPLGERATPDLVISIASAAKVAGVLDVLVTSPREPRSGVDLEVEATLPQGTKRAKILDVRRAMKRAIEQLTPTMKVLTTTDDDPPLVLRVVGLDLTQVRRAGIDVTDALEKSPEMHGVLDLEARMLPELEPRVDQPAAAELGLAAVDIAHAIRIAMRGEQVSTIFTASSSKPVWLQLKLPTAPETFTQLRLHGTPLSAVVSWRQRVEPEDVEHWNRERAVTLWIDGTQRSAQTAVQGVRLPSGVRLVWEN